MGWAGVPPSVAIDEAVSQRAASAPIRPRFVNGVLDAVGRTLEACGAARDSIGIP
jgi:transcription termination factor NusB